MASFFVFLVFTLICTCKCSPVHLSRKLDTIIGQIESLRADLYSTAGRIDRTFNDDDPVQCQCNNEDDYLRNNFLAVNERIFMARDQVLSALENYSKVSSTPEILQKIREMKADFIDTRSEILSSLSTSLQTFWTFQDRFLAIISEKAER